MLRFVESVIQKLVIVVIILLAGAILIRNLEIKARGPNVGSTNSQEVAIQMDIENSQNSKTTTHFYGYCDAGLNIREKMDLDSTWLGQYPKNSTILILEDLGDWYRVEGGYVKKEFVYDSVWIYERGVTVTDSIVMNEANAYSQYIGYVQIGEIHNFVRKKNGYLLIENGGWIPESAVSFDFYEVYDYPAPNLTVDDMSAWNMPNIRIRYIGAISERTKAECVTGSGSLYFKDSIPVYDIIDGFAYFPSGQKIYKMRVDKFSDFHPVGPEHEVLDAYRTVYYSSGSGRRHNIELVSSIIDGTVVKSGSTFSYNKTTGSRSESKGYQVAPVIKDGEYVNDFGGGVCQVSSTIYAAVMNDPNIKVTERKKHGLDVSYIPYSMDATVSYDSIDLKFVNNYPFDIRINVYARDGVCMVVLEKAH